jgi:hypothetical protein
MNQQNNFSLKYALKNKSEMDKIVVNDLAKLKNELKDKFNIKKAKFVFIDEEGEEYEIKNQNDYNKLNIALGQVNLKEANLIIKLNGQKKQPNNTQTENITEDSVYRLEESESEFRGLTKDNRNKKTIK